MFRPISRRHLIQTAAGLAAAATLTPSWSQPGKPIATGRNPVVAQVVDMSAGQIDVSKDFLIGSRAAWQEINARGGLHGRSVQHLVIEVDGGPRSLKDAWAQLRDNAACVALSGTCGGAAASQLTHWLRAEGGAMAHAAPWLQNALEEADERTFTIFANRQTQIAHALKSLATVGVRQLGVVYATAQDQALYAHDVQRSAELLHLDLRAFHATADLRALGQQLTPVTPAILLFVGGTPELARFTQGLERQTRQRYVIGIADVNLQTLMQMGSARHTPVIATQTVPLTTSSLPLVRSYRATLARLFDEPPTPQSLAGYIAARYTHEVLSDVDGPLTRASALAAFQRRTTLDLGGFQITTQPRRQGATFVTQSMLTSDGRIVG